MVPPRPQRRRSGSTQRGGRDSTRASRMRRSVGNPSRSHWTRWSTTGIRYLPPRLGLSTAPRAQTIPLQGHHPTCIFETRLPFRLLPFRSTPRPTIPLKMASSTSPFHALLKGFTQHHCALSWGWPVSAPPPRSFPGIRRRRRRSRKPSQGLCGGGDGCALCSGASECACKSWTSCSTSIPCIRLTHLSLWIPLRSEEQETDPEKVQRLEEMIVILREASEIIHSKSIR